MVGPEILCVVLLPVAVGVLVWWLVVHGVSFSRGPADRAPVTAEDAAPPEAEEELDVAVPAGEVAAYLGRLAGVLDGGLTASQAEVLAMRVANEKGERVVQGTYFVKAGEVSGQLGVWCFRDRSAGQVVLTFRAVAAVLAVVGRADGVKG